MLAKRILLIVCYAGLALSLWGCAPELVGPNAAAYSVSTLHAVTDHDMTRVYQAAAKAVTDLEMEVTDQSKDVFSAKVVGKSADGKVVTISMKPREDGLTSIKLRVGSFGDEHKSRAIYDRIQKNLGIGGK